MRGSSKGQWSVNNSEDQYRRGQPLLLRRSLRLRPRVDLASLPHFPLLARVVLHLVLLLLRVLRVLRLLRLLRPMRLHLPQPLLRLLMQGGRSTPFL